MKKLLLIIIISTVAFSSSQAKIWRINNQAGIYADFTSGQAAHNAASAGDTLYFESSPTVYGSLVIEKQLTIMGMGAFLANYSGYQLPGAVNATLTGIEIKLGGSGTIISGLKVSASIQLENVSNIKVNKTESYGLDLLSVTNSVFSNNYFTSATTIGSLCTNLVFSNNILGGLYSSSVNSNSLNIFQNSFVGGSLAGHNLTITNNIISNASAFSNCSISYNIFQNGSYNNNGLTTSSGGGNLFSKLVASIFTQSGTEDLYYQLKAGSPAIGASSTGGDCGATGGTNPYVFNGLQPAIPSIYKLVVPGIVTGTTMPVIISTRSNN